MSDNQFENIITLLNDPNLESVTQGLMLWETLMDLGEDREFYRSKLDEIDFTELKGIFSYGFGGKKIPSWLRKAKFRLYVSLWALGYLAKHSDEMALSIKKIELNDPEFSTFPETFVHLTALTHFELQRSKWTALEDVWSHFPNLIKSICLTMRLSLPSSFIPVPEEWFGHHSITELDCVRSMTGYKI